MELKQQVQILTSTINTLASQKTTNESCKLRDEIKLLIKTFGGMDKLEELLQAASTKQVMVQHFILFFLLCKQFYVHYFYLLKNLEKPFF